MWKQIERDLTFRTFPKPVRIVAKRVHRIGWAVVKFASLFMDVEDHDFAS